MFIRQTYRIYPNREQQKTLIQWIGQSRYVWNYMLNLNIKQYETDQTFVFAYSMNNLLPELKKNPETEWLSESPSQCLQQKCQDLDSALKQSFKSKKSRKGFPKFKSRHKDESGIRFPTFKFEGNRIVLPKMKQGIKIKLHRPLQGSKGAVTIKRDKTGSFYASILVKVEDHIFNPIPVDTIEHSVGVDLGLKEFAVTSDCEIIKNPKFGRTAHKKIAKLQKSHSKKQKGSNNREKARVKVAKAYKKVTNQRKDFVSQTASSIAKNYDLISIENLNIKGMMKNHCLARSVADVSWGNFVDSLKWQTKKRGKHLVIIDRWYPSSKTCSACGSHKADLTLGDRTYICSDCGLELDRDLNAAINIHNEGMRIFLSNNNTVGTTEINACGDMILPEGRSAQEAVSLF